MITVVNVPSNTFPLHLFFERLSGAGIDVSIRDYRRISRVLAAEGEWTLARLERVLGNLLVRDRDERVLFRHEFRAFFKAELAELRQDAPVIDVQLWRDKVAQLLKLPDSERPSSPRDSPPRVEEGECCTGKSIVSTLRSVMSSAWRWVIKVAVWFVILGFILQPTVFNPDETPVATPSSVAVKTTDTLNGKPPLSDFITVQLTTAPEPVIDRRILPEVWLPAAVLAGLLAVGLLGWWWTQLRPPAVRQKVFCDPDLPGKYFEDASVGGVMPPWLAETETDHLADLLKYVLSDRYTHELDMAASIQATSESGSVPVLRFKKRRDLQKILILTDQMQQGFQLPAELAQALQARGVQLTFGRFNNSPVRFVDQDQREQHLEDWEDYRHHLLLLIFADTHQAEGLQDFPWRDWPDARLLTRQEQRNWDFREQGLQVQGVRLLQADGAGVVQAWGELPRQSAVLEAGRWEADGQKPGETTPDFLQRVLGAALPWARALAHYPGAWPLAAAEQLRTTLYPEVPRLALQRLLNLPGSWVGAGVAAFESRIQVALRLGFQQCEAQQAEVVGAWQKMMTAAEPPKDSLAWAAWRWKCIRLAWPLDPDHAAEALHTLVVSAPALADAIRADMRQTAAGAGLLQAPQTRKGQRHLLEVADACGLTRAVMYAPADRYRRAGLLSVVGVVLLVGVGLWNAQVGAPPPVGVVAGASVEVPVPHLVQIPAGVFEMGCVENQDCEDNEKPVHTVTVPTFELGAYEVTVGQFRAFVEAKGYQTTAEQVGSCWSYDASGSVNDVKGNSWRKTGYAQTDDSPVTCVSWDDAQAYLRWLSDQTKQGWRLPSEAEWEYATRAGTKTAYSWGAESPVCDTQAAQGAQFSDCKEKAPLTVGSFIPNPFGLYDVHGNALEWVEDCWQGDYKTAPVDGTAVGGCDAGASRVLRGGAWDDRPRGLRSAYRSDNSPVDRNDIVGFRAARTINPLPFTDDGTAVQVAAPSPSGQVVPAVLPPTATDAQQVFAPTMVQIPAGTFTMGCDPMRDDVEGGCSDDEKPAHKVSVPTFWLSETEVTVKQYLACVTAGACPEPEWRGKDAPSYYTDMGAALTGDNYPIVGVSWDNAQAYVQWLSQQTGKQYRLPTEAEWEYAARAGTDTAYPWGNGIGKNNANCSGDLCGEKFEYTSPVGSFARNPFGLADMHGNVWEWVEDCWVGDYKTAPADGTAVGGCDAGASRVLRGGAWINIPQWLRSASRYSHTPDYRFNIVGFRAARTY